MYPPPVTVRFSVVLSSDGSTWIAQTQMGLDTVPPPQRAYRMGKAIIQPPFGTLNSPICIQDRTDNVGGGPLVRVPQTRIISIAAASSISKGPCKVHPIYEIPTLLPKDFAV